MENQIQGPILVGNLEDSEKAIFYRKTYTAEKILVIMLNSWKVDCN